MAFVRPFIVALLAAVWANSASSYNICYDITITRGDTNKDVTSGIVVLDQMPQASNPTQIRCALDGYYIWAPTSESDYGGVSNELRSQGSLQTFTERLHRNTIAYNQHLSFYQNGPREEGIYYCTNILNRGCFVGVFERRSLVANDVRVNQITHTGFDVFWSQAASLRYVRGYKLTVRSEEGGVVYEQDVPVSSEPQYSKKVSCLLPGKEYTVAVEALYSFQPQSKGFYKISEQVVVSTPDGPNTEECVDTLDAAILTVKAHPLSKMAVSLSWTVPSGVQPIRSVISYRNVLSSTKAEKVVEGPSNEVEIISLDPGSTYMFSVAVEAKPASSRATKAVSQSSESVYFAIRNDAILDQDSFLVGWALNSTSVLLRWNESSLMASGCTPAQHYVDVEELGAASGEGTPVESVSLHAPSSSVVVADLKAFRRYRFSLRTVCQDQVHSHTAQTDIQTRASGPSEAPNVVKVTLYTSVAVLDIKLPQFDNRNGDITSYTLLYGKNDESSLAPSTTEVEIAALSCVDTTRYIIEGLQSGVEYSFQLAASNQAGTGPYTQWDLFTTLPM